MITVSFINVSCSEPTLKWRRIPRPRDGGFGVRNPSTRYGGAIWSLLLITFGHVFADMVGDGRGQQSRQQPGEPGVEAPAAQCHEAPGALLPGLRDARLTQHLEHPSRVAWRRSAPMNEERVNRSCDVRVDARFWPVKSSPLTAA